MRITKKINNGTIHFYDFEIMSNLPDVEISVSKIKDTPETVFNYFDWQYPVISIVKLDDLSFSDKRYTYYKIFCYDMKTAKRNIENNGADFYRKNRNLLNKFIIEYYIAIKERTND